MQKDVQDAASDVQQSIHKTVGETENDIAGIWSGVNKAYDGSDQVSTDSVTDSTTNTMPTPAQLSVKNKLFRRKKLARTSAVPTWFKHQTGRRTRVISGAARVAKYRPSGTAAGTAATITRSFH